jgi:hypothetical protein
VVTPKPAPIPARPTNIMVIGSMFFLSIGADRGEWLLGLASLSLH